MKVLIAEDDVTSRRMLETVLRKWEYEVVAVADGDEAWQILRGEGAPQLAVLDWMMPEMDGVEVCRKARKLGKHDPTYIILLTTLDRKENVAEGLEAGADDYVTKPFDNRELRARIRVGQRIVELQTALANRVEELEQALSHIQTLQGILPICMHCHKIRTDQESWERLENYIEGHSDAEFSHALCPECLDKHYPEGEEDEEEEELEGP